MSNVSTVYFTLVHVLHTQEGIVYLSESSVIFFCNLIFCFNVKRGESTDSEDCDEILVSSSDDEVTQDDSSYGGKVDGCMIDEEETIDNMPTKEKQLRKATTANYNWLVDFLKEEL